MDENMPSTSRKRTGDKISGSGFMNQKIKHSKVKNTIINIQHLHQPATTSQQQIRSCCDTIDDEGNKRCTVFKKNLQELYSKLILPKLAWLDEGLDLSLEEHFIQLELQDSQKSIQVEEIFESEDNKRPVRILIEGQPGFGKTTLTIKLTHDWAANKKYIINFDFAFLVPLKELQQRGIADAIQQIGERCDCEDAVEIVNQHKKSVLFILDGLDELSLEERQEMMKILFKQIYRDVTVMVSCRTGLFALSKKENKELFGLTKMQNDFSDKRISILGIANEQNKRIFLEKFSPKVSVESVIECLSSQWDIFNSPLLLMALSVLIQEGETIEEFITKTALYKKLCNHIVKHSYSKHERDLASDFDLLCLNSSANPIQESVRQFGKASIQKIVKNDLNFDSDESTKEIYELGFLIRHKEITYVNAKIHFEALHLSVMEFAAAFACWMDLKCKTSASIEDDLNLIVNHFVDSEGTSLVLPFLASLMGGELDLLLSQIDTFSVWFSSHFDLTAQLIAECLSINISKSKNLRHFIPFVITFSNIDSSDLKLKELLLYGSDCGKIEKIRINSSTDFETLTLEMTVCFQVEMFSDKYTLLAVVGNSLLFSNPIPFAKPLKELLHFAASSNCQSCVLTLKDSSSIAQFCASIMQEKLLSQIKYHHLRIETSAEFELQIATKLLENDQVQHLHLLYKDTILDSDSSDFLRSAARSMYLTCIELKGIIVDLYQLTNGGTKKYTFMSFISCDLTCSEPLLFTNCCRHLKINDVRGIEAVLQMAPSSFSCWSADNAIINDLIARYPTWTGFNCVTTLELRLYQDLSLLFPWRNLQTLVLIRIKDMFDQNELSRCIFALPIVNLVIINNNSTEDFHLFKQMNKLCADGMKSHIKTIFYRDFYLNVKTPTIMCDLIKGVVYNHWDKIYRVAPDVSLFNLPDFREIPESSFVQITQANNQSILLELGLFTLAFFPQNPSDFSCYNTIMCITKNAMPSKQMSS